MDQATVVCYAAFDSRRADNKEEAVPSREQKCKTLTFCSRFVASGDPCWGLVQAVWGCDSLIFMHVGPGGLVMIELGLGVLVWCLVLRTW